MTGAEITYSREGGLYFGASFQVSEPDNAAYIEVNVDSSGLSFTGHTCDFSRYGPVEVSERRLFEILVSIRERRPDLWARVGTGGAASPASDIQESFLGEDERS